MRRILALSARDQGAASEWRVGLQHAKMLEFDTICCGTARQQLLSDQILDDLPLSGFAQEVVEAGLDIILDLELDALPERYPIDGQTVRAKYLDPRSPPGKTSGALISFDDWENASDAASRRWIETVADRIAKLQSIGIKGFRFLNSERVPFRAWRALFDAVQQRQTSDLFLAAAPTRPFALQQENPGFNAAVVPVSINSRPDMASITAAYPTVVGTPEVTRSAGTEELIEALRWCGGLTDGILLPLALEKRATAKPKVFGPAKPDKDTPIEAAVTALNRFLREAGEPFDNGTWTETALASSAFRAVIRTGFSSDGDYLRLVVTNVSGNHRAVDLSELATQIGEFLPLRDAMNPGRTPLASAVISLRAGEVRVFEGLRSSRISPDARPAPDVSKALRARRLVIENVDPVIDGGRFAVKRIVGERMHVEADAYGEGHDGIAVALRWRPADELDWRETPMTQLGNDRWAGEFTLEKTGRYLFTVAAWRDEFAIYRDHLQKKAEVRAHEPVDIEEGRRLIAAISREAVGEPAGKAIQEIAAALAQADDEAAVRLMLAPTTAKSAALASPRPFFTQAETEFAIDVERKAAGFASWYSLFPRSQSGDVNRHGTFADVEKRLPAIKKMGFDVLYMTPIHPIGAKNRKGRNNTLRPLPGDPGSPYAIGSEDGGHDAIHPELGTWDDFDRLIAATRAHAMEIALDIAIQASPDHPWLKEHPDWFEWRPDGSIRYAENPPKKYEDIVNVDFYAKGAKPSLWLELRDVILKWVSHGVKTFRIDNPHTKPFPFWEWVIAEVRRKDPDVLFLSEAFTRPKVMYRLAKIGFSQSYTYFTWRSGKAELIEYISELAHGPAKEFFRPNFFVNTHDINPDYLQNAPRAAFLIRAALATTLSGLWGIYNGFELCEGRPDEKKKEYADSEKYQLVAWDWNRPGNIIAEITTLNRMRRENRALQSHLGVDFLTCQNGSILYFEKATPRRDSVILVAISLDAFQAQEADIEIPLWKFGLPDQGSLMVEDLLRGDRFSWTGKIQHIRLDPNALPFAIWRLRHSGA